MRRNEGPLAFSAIDFLSCLLLVVLALIAPPPEPQSPSVEQEGVYLLIATWPKALDYDVDVYVQDPAGRIVFFANPDLAGIHLARDDLGAFNDTAGNEERVTFRAVEQGEYVVTIHAYKTRGPVSVKVVLHKLRGHDGKVLERTVRLRGEGDELTFTRFTVDKDGLVVGLSDLPKTLADVA